MVDIKNLVLGIAIFILTVSVGIYGINTFYGSQPKYEDYCPNIYTKELCLNSGRVWINNSGENIAPPGKTAPIDAGSCNYDYTKCQKELDDAREKYSKGAFFIALPLGIIVIAVGAIIFGLATVGGGLMAGGVGILLYGIVQFWEFAQDYLKFGMSLLGLIIVIALAYYANKKWLKK
ncbi:MAG: hypothetical protein Q8N99_03830 [Nanoarchaeota archaeon]|nr:hypothetical protein [Nanoarchaeota archaeon]